MDLMDIVNCRLFNQQIAQRQFNNAKDAVAYMGALQSQDYAMAKWAIGLRCGLNEKAINHAINNYEIIRTHILRPTWHFVAAADIRWMLTLSAPYVKANNASMAKKMELDDKLFTKCNKIIKDYLKENNHSTREELMIALSKKKIVANDIRSALIMINAELDGIVCSGEMRGKQFTYTLFNDVIPDAKPITKDEALIKLLNIYFTSHGPATVQDFCWWSGIPISVAKKGLALIKSNIQSIQIEKEVYWFHGSFPDKKDVLKGIYLLPAFDELIISYKDKSLLLDEIAIKESITNNGIFRPTIVVNGKIIGLWKRAIVKDKAIINLSYFNSIKKFPHKSILAAVKNYGDFLEMKIVVE